MIDTHPIPTNHRAETRDRRSEAGFTLPELLLSSALGALLLTSLAVATYTFTETLTHLEIESGVADPVYPTMGMLTTQVREGWWVEVPNSTTLRIADEDNEVIEYSFDANEGELVATLPDETVSIVMDELAGVAFEAATATRLREDTPTTSTATWFSQSGTGIPIALETPVGGAAAFAFVADVDALGESEQLLSARIANVTLPISLTSGSGSKIVTATLYESRAPYDGRPFGPALATTTFSGEGTLPSTMSFWDDDEEILIPPFLPTSLNIGGLGVALEPGVGYTLVLSVDGTSQLVFAGYPDAFSPGAVPDVRVLDPLGGGDYDLQALVVPMNLTGDATQTATTSSDVVTQVSMTLTPTGNRPSLNRSASILSQVVSDDPWLGVIPNETAP